MQPGTGEGQATVPRERRTLGQTNTLLERGVDLERLCGDRLRKVQAEMRARDVGALLLMDSINIRYVTGVSVMPLWSATNLAHYRQARFAEGLAAERSVEWAAEINDTLTGWGGADARL